MAKRTKITCETTWFFALRGTNFKRAWCARCAAEGEMISPEHIPVICNLDQHVVEEWLNSPELHRLHSDDGAQLICLSSLLARLLNTRTS